MSFLTNMQQYDLYYKLATLLHAGFDLSRSASLIHPKSKNAKAVVQAISDGAEKGEKLYEILEASGCVPAYASGLLQTGDMSGRTEEALLSLAAYYKQQDARARQIRSAVFYPLMLLAVMLAVIAVLLVRILPVFDTVYASLGGSMTGAAGALLALGQRLKASAPAIMAVIASIATGTAICVFCRPVKHRLAGLWRSRFGDKGLSRKINNARLAQAMAMGVQSGMPLEDAVRLAGQLTTDIKPAHDRCEACARALSDGETNQDEALASSGILPGDCCELLAIAQQGGTADTALDEISRRLSHEADRAVDGLVSKIEPAVIMLCAILTGTILLAVMMPLMDIMAALG